MTLVIKHSTSDKPSSYANMNFGIFWLLFVHCIIFFKCLQSKLLDFCTKLSTLKLANPKMLLLLSEMYFMKGLQVQVYCSKCL